MSERPIQDIIDYYETFDIEELYYVLPFVLESLKKFGLTDLIQKCIKPKYYYTKGSLFRNLWISETFDFALCIVYIISWIPSLSNKRL